MAVSGRFCGMHVGGWGEIRTHGTLAGPAVFKTAALNHSATHPHGGDTGPPTPRQLPLPVIDGGGHLVVQGAIRLDGSSEGAGHHAGSFQGRRAVLLREHQRLFAMAGRIL